MKIFTRSFPLFAVGLLLLTEMSVVRAASLTLGATISGVISIPGQQDSYTFDGAPGQRVYYDALDGDFDPIGVRLISPSGATVNINGNSDSDVGPFTLIESGAYTLIIDGNGATTGDYSFRLLDIATQPVLDVGQTITKTLTPGYAADIYRVIGTPGLRLFFDAQGGGAGGSFWALLGPNNEQVPNASVNIAGDFEVTLTQSGTYVLVVSGNNASPVLYSFQAVNFDTPTDPLTLNTTVTGSLVKPGDQHLYTFQGSPGQRLYYDALDGDFDPIAVRLVSPSGAIVNINGNSDSDVGPFTLIESGTYTLIIDGNGSTTGDYSFRLLDIAAQPVLNIGQVITKTLTPGYSADLYRVIGTPGLRLFFDAQGGSAGGSVWGLFGPNNEQVPNASANLVNDFEVTLTQSGTYVLVASGNNSSPVLYAFQAVNFDTPTDPLTLNTTVTGILAKPGDQHLYTFNGSSGQRLYYDALDVDNDPISVKLLNPAGAIVYINNNSDTDVGPFTLTDSGTYTLIIDGSGSTTGDYSFRLDDLLTAQPLTLNSMINGQLTPRSETDFYQFNGVSGQRIHPDSISASSGEASWYLIGPANQNLASGGITSDLPDTILPATGVYYLLIAGTTANATPLSYQVQLNDLSDPPATTTALGDVKSGTISGAQPDTITFTAPAGLLVYFDSQDRSNSGLTAELRDPSNTVIFSIATANDSGPYILPRSGNYTLTIRGSGSPGTYRFRLLDLAQNATPLSLNNTVAAMLDAGYKTDVYQFAGTAGQRLYYDALDNDFDSVSVRLWAPSGGIAYINGNSDSDVGPFTLGFAGTYYLFIESNLSTVTDYSFRLLDVANQPLLATDSAKSGTLDPGLGNLLFRFAASTGQRLFFDGMSGANATWTLYGPNNDYLGSAGLAGDFEVTLPEPGTFVVVVSGNSASPIPYSFQVVNPDKISAQPGQPTITSVGVAAKVLTITWSAEPGKIYRVQSKAKLNDANWSDLGGDVTASTASASKVDNLGPGDQQKFYRIQVVQ